MRIRSTDSEEQSRRPVYHNEKSSLPFSAKEDAERVLALKMQYLLLQLNEYSTSRKIGTETIVPRRYFAGDEDVAGALRKVKHDFK